MLEEFITDTNNFNEKQVDNDVITENKTYFSIYNNKINQPFHKFWFTLSNCKYFTSYNGYSTLRFAFNNKSNSSQKFIQFIKKLSDYLKKIFEKTFDDVTIDCPWKEFQNYPFLLTFYTNNDLIFVDSNQNTLEFDKLDNYLSYSLLFEIKNLKIIKTQLDSETKYNLKYNMSILMIQQEKQLDLKSYLLNKISFKVFESNQENLNSSKNNNSRPNLPFLSQLSSGNLKSDSEARNESSYNVNSKNNTGGPIGLINLNELLEVKSKLIKVNLEQDRTSYSDDNKSGKNNTILENALVEQKNQLKKVKTKEKTLLKELKKSKKKSKNKFEDIVDIVDIVDIEKNTNTKSKEDLELELKLEMELEKDLETKDMPKSESFLKILKPKKKSNIEDIEKINKKLKKKSKDKTNEVIDLEKELELLG